MTKINANNETPVFTFKSTEQEVLRLDDQGFHYAGQIIEDAGEAHRLFLNWLKQNPTIDQATPVELTQPGK